MILKSISKETGLDVRYLAKVVASASHRYKTYRIKKRTGGYRTIHHPSRELKLIQRWLITNVLSSLDVSGSAFAYVRGKNIRQLASRHAKSNFLLRIDFKDFFPSIHAQEIRSLLSRNQLLDQVRLDSDDIESIVKVVCRHSRLTIGAPTSPLLSNAVMYDLDCHWDALCTSFGARYTRYADDLYISTSRPDVLQQVFEEIKSDVRKTREPDLRINRKKTVFTSRKRRRLVTGLVLTSDRKVSIGRSKKRKIRALIHQVICGQADSAALSYVRGYLSYAASVDPTFVQSLRRKYGARVIRQIRTE